MNRIYYPILNPVPMYELNPTMDPAHMTKHFLDYPFEDLIQDWEEPVEYVQPWNTLDTVPFQFISNFNPIQIDIIDLMGNVIAPFVAPPGRQDTDNPGWYAYELFIPMAGLSGCYRFKLSGGGIPLMVSRIQQVSANSKGTILFAYRNSRKHGDVLFETGITMKYRVIGTIGRVGPGENAISMDSQRYNPTVLSSKQFRSFPLSIGGTYGIPDEDVDLIANIFSCDDVKLDGKKFAKPSDSKYEFNEQEDYPLRGMGVNIREGINRGSRIIEPGVNPNRRATVAYGIDTSIFGDKNTAGISSRIRITAVE